MVYSLLIASTTCRLAAFRAGINPDIIPMIVENNNANRTSSGVTIATEVLVPILPIPMILIPMLDITPTTMNPRNTPSSPPMRPMIPDSVRNSFMISEFRVPMDFRMPMSLVRSITDINMVFAIPIAPTRREIAAMPVRKKVKVAMVL